MLLLAGVYWRPLAASSAACLLAMAIGCFANWLRNRSYHCAITGPLFLAGGLVLLFSGMHLIAFNIGWVWPFVLIGTCVAFLLEWRYAKRPESKG
jgi:hypothetical protein